MVNANVIQTIQPTPVFRQCFGCNYEAVTADERCPRCGTHKFFTSGNIRVRGGLMLALGTFLVALMGTIAVSVGFLIAGAAKDPQTAQKFNGDLGNLLLIYCVFAAVIAFGANTAVSGGWMLVAGKRNRFLMWVMWVLFVAVTVGGVLTQVLLGD